MQVRGLPRQIVRNGCAASRLLAEKAPNIGAETRRDAVARWRRAMANGLTAEQASPAVDEPRSTLYRWEKAPDVRVTHGIGNGLERADSSAAAERNERRHSLRIASEVRRNDERSSRAAKRLADLAVGAGRWLVGPFSSSQMSGACTWKNARIGSW